MKALKTVAALAFLFVPSIALAAFDVAKIPTFQNRSMAQNNRLELAEAARDMSRPIESDSLRVPNLMELNQQIDKNDTAIEKRPLPNFKLSPTTQKIINKLPKNLSKARKAPKGKAKLNTADFKDQPESNIKITPDETIAPKTMFEVSVADKRADLASDELLMASKAYAVGQYESAIAIYKNVLKKDPKNRDALFGLATSYHRAGQRGQAKIQYGKLLEAYPYDEEGQNNFLSLVGEEAPQDALKELGELAKANPDYASIYAQKAMIYMKMGDDNNAIKNMYQALKLNSNNSEYKYNLAVLFDRNGYYENASRLYTDLVEGSYNGGGIPVSRFKLAERISFLNSKIKVQN